MALDFIAKNQLHNGIGVDVVNPTSYEDVLEQTHLDFEVEGRDVFTTDNNGAFLRVDGKKAIVNTKDESPLGIVSDHYMLVQNKDAFGFTKDIFDTNAISFTRGGVYKGGKATWLEAKVDGQFNIFGDNIDCYVLFMNHHDGLGSVRVLNMPTRTACQNVLNFRVAEASRVWSCRHRGTLANKMTDAQRVLLEGSEYMKAIAREAEVLNNIILTPKQIAEFVDRLFPIDNPKKPLTEKQIENQELRRTQLKLVYLDKDDLQNFNDTGYRFISAVVDYVNHVEGKKTKDGLLNRFINVANGNPLVDFAYDMVLRA